MHSAVWLFVAGLSLFACQEAPGTSDGATSGGGVNALTPDAGAAAGGAGTGGTFAAGGAFASGGTFVSGAGGRIAAGGAGGLSSGSGGDGNGGVREAGGAGFDAGSEDSGGANVDPIAFAAGLHELFIHDACIGPNPSQPDTCLHEQLVEEAVVFGGEAGRVYDVVLRVRGLFEPTTIAGGQTPLPEHPYFKVGGTVSALDYSHWHIEVSDPPQTYSLNHYPSTSHTIYQEDFEATLQIAAGAHVTVRVVDGNDRQIDNAREGLPDRRQLIDGVTAAVLDGQVLRLDVIAVEER